MSGTKFDQEKVDLHVLDPLFIEGTARVAQFGEQKYGRSNWMQGITQSRIINAMRRHLGQIEKGEDIDEESGYHHGYHIAWGCQVLAHQHRNNQTELDDRRWGKNFQHDDQRIGSSTGIGGHTMPMLSNHTNAGLHIEPSEKVRLDMSDLQPKANEGTQKDTITESQRMIAKWADVVYPDRTAEHALTKMMLHEIPELLQSGVDDPLEFADVAILLFDIAHLKGIDIGEAIEQKMMINRDRMWAVDPKTGVMSHVKKAPVNPVPRCLTTPIEYDAEKLQDPPSYPWLITPPMSEQKIKEGDRVRILPDTRIWSKIPNNSRCILMHKNQRNRSFLEKFYCATIKDVVTEIEYNVSWSEIESWRD